jgi:hypothetical protein
MDNKQSHQGGIVRITQTADGTGRMIEYTTMEKWVAFSLTFYLFLAFVVGLLLILDVWTEQFYGLRWMKFPLPTDTTALGLLQLVIYAMAGGWLGGVISSVRSLQEHYVAPVENLDNLKKQEETRFHTSWWTRWFWGPWQGMGLALIVIALVRSGVLVFGATNVAPATSGTMTDSFATFGLGALVGIGAKDVIEKLSQVLKTWLKVEEPEAQKLKILPEGAKEAKYGGTALEFTVEPAIPVTWTIDPAGENVGTIINGIFRPAGVSSTGAQAERYVIVTATSKADVNRSASTSLTLKTQ